MEQPTHDEQCSWGSRRLERIQRVSVELDAVLESVDLEAETQLADDVVEAIKATDRAHELEAGGPPVDNPGSHTDVDADGDGSEGDSSTHRP